jgi:hypothetical protein
MVWLAAEETTCAKAALPRYEPSPQGLVFVTADAIRLNAHVAKIGGVPTPAGTRL